MADLIALAMVAGGLALTAGLLGLLVMGLVMAAGEPPARIRLLGELPKPTPAEQRDIGRYFINRED